MSAKSIDKKALLIKQIQAQGIVFVVFNTAMLMFLFVLIKLYLDYPFSFDQVFKMMVFSCALNMIIYVFGSLLNAPHKTKLSLVTLGFSIIFLPTFMTSLIRIVSGLDLSWYALLVAALMLASYKLCKCKCTNNTADKRSPKSNTEKQHKNNQNSQYNNHIDNHFSHCPSNQFTWLPYLPYIICFYRSFYQCKSLFIAVVYPMQIMILATLLLTFKSSNYNINTTTLILQSYFISVVIYSIFKLWRSFYVTE